DAYADRKVGDATNDGQRCYPSSQARALLFRPGPTKYERSIESARRRDDGCHEELEPDVAFCRLLHVRMAAEIQGVSRQPHEFAGQAVNNQRQKDIAVEDVRNRD